MALIVGAGLAVRFRDLIRSRIAYIIKAGVVAAGCFVVVVAYPVYEMLRGPGHISGPVVEVSLLQSARADLLGVIVPTSNQLLAPHFLSWIGDYFVGENLSENGTYLGIPLLILLIVILRKLKKDSTVMVMAYAALAAWVLSLGGHLVIGTWNSPIPLPGDLLAHMPLFDNTIPARYALYVILPVAFIVAVGLDRIWLSSFRSPGSDRYAELEAGPGHGRLRALMRSRRARLFILAGVIAITLLPDAPFASATVPWPAALPATVQKFVAPGTVVLPVPFATPSSAEAMAWAAVDDMGFRIIGGYANIADPGQPHGQRQPPALPPAHVQEMFSTPKLGSMLPYVPPTVADAQLITYLDRYSVGAVVLVSMGPDTSIGYWYLTDTLGQPEIVRPGFATVSYTHLPEHPRLLGTGPVLSLRAARPLDRRGSRHRSQYFCEATSPGGPHRVPPGAPVEGSRFRGRDPGRAERGEPRNSHRSRASALQASDVAQPDRDGHRVQLGLGRRGTDPRST